MPELPEVETIRRDLTHELLNDQVVSTEVRDARLLNGAKLKAWEREVHGRRWTSIDRHGKFLLITLDTGFRIVFHLRMTGQMVMGTTPVLPWRMALTFSSKQQLYFCDQRRFGEVWLLAPGVRWHNQHVPGPDALTFSSESFQDLVRSRPTQIHALLLNQQLIAGIGNIYSQEALFKAGIRPMRPGNRIRTEEAQKLYDSLLNTLETAIRYRGSTSRNYRDAYGQSGNAQSLHAVYRKGGRPCSRCGEPLQSVRVGGRGAVYCRQCQR